TMLEFYTAYKDVNWMMDFCEEMLRATVQNVTGALRVQFDRDMLTKFEFDFASRFERLSMKEAIVKYWPVEWRTLGGEEFSEGWLDDLRRLQSVCEFIPSGRNILTNRAFGKPSEINGETWANDVQTAWEEAKWKSTNLFTLSEEPEEAQAAQRVTHIFEEIAEEQLIQPTF